ncbi:MAG TPA: glutamine synthetase family protein [Burkholderiales bacterium]|nr:glutamine synthetase family protein [Burkholderiales bacterium]
MKELLKEIKSRRIETVRFSFADQHGILRSKSIAAAEVPAALKSGVGFPSSLLAKDTSNKTVFPVFTPGAGLGMPEFEGAADAVMVADPASFRVLPWAHKTGWLLCDLRFPNGKPVPFDTRALLKNALAKLARAGYGFLAGLEVEFHIFRIVDPRLRPEDAGQPGSPPTVELLNTGYQLLSEARFDQLEPALELLRTNLAGLGLPLRSFECEFGPSQVEITLSAQEGLAAADTMLLFRSAAKQALRRRGYHATFMCRPKLPNAMSSGWHLHQSLLNLSDKKNSFIPKEKNQPLSPIGQQYLSGLLKHARAACAFATPTINGYKRYRPYSLAPERVIWGRDSRGAMLRVVGGPGDPATRIENRIGEPGANPYLYFASQIHTGMDGMHRKLSLGKPEQTPYESKAQLLPRSLDEAIQYLKTSKVLRDGMGPAFVDYYCRIKQAEVERYQAGNKAAADDREVSEWEHREYFDLL